MTKEFAALINIAHPSILSLQPISVSVAEDLDLMLCFCLLSFLFLENFIWKSFSYPLTLSMFCFDPTDCFCSFDRMSCADLCSKDFLPCRFSFLIWFTPNLSVGLKLSLPTCRMCYLIIQVRVKLCPMHSSNLLSSLIPEFDSQW